MIGDAVRYLRRASGIAIAVATEPLEVLIEIEARWKERRERDRPACPYQAEPDWERRLHEVLGMPWPCPADSEFWALWPAVIGALQAKGVRVGRGAFGGWGDGEPGLVRTVWCLARHLRPADVVETGVARGFSSRFILEALERNGAGHLWSIDRPPLTKPNLYQQIGAAVGNRYHDRWSYIRGSSRRRLPHLLSQLGRIDLFVHDSRHSEYNVRFELDRAWASLRPGGALVVDDIDLNWGFRSFIESFSGHRFLICQAEPLQPDPGRFDGKGLFGIVHKNPAGC